MKGWIDDAMHEIGCWCIVYMYNGGWWIIAMKRKGKNGRLVIDYLSTGVGGVVISLVALTGFVKLTGFGQTY